MDWPQEVTSFWFELAPEQWWKADPELDREIAERFRELWEEQKQCPVQTFLGSAEEALGAVILFDQFPRNMFRGDAESFATDHLALATSKAAIERGYDDELSPQQRGFLYMPFQHSEDLDDQLRSVGLFTALGDPNQLRFARLHHDVIERFGRFPHRNSILGRKLRAKEIAAGDVVPW
jgi:uncharacterized protein (DUF924 family)